MGYGDPGKHQASILCFTIASPSSSIAAAWYPLDPVMATSKAAHLGHSYMSSMPFVAYRVHWPKMGHFDCNGWTWPGVTANAVSSLQNSSMHTVYGHQRLHLEGKGNCEAPCATSCITDCHAFQAAASQPCQCLLHCLSVAFPDVQLHLHPAPKCSHPPDGRPQRLIPCPLFFLQTKRQGGCFNSHVVSA